MALDFNRMAEKVAAGIDTNAIQKKVKAAMQQHPIDTTIDVNINAKPNVKNIDKAEQTVRKQIQDEINLDDFDSLEIEQDVVPRFKLDTDDVREQLDRIGQELNALFRRENKKLNKIIDDIKITSNPVDKASLESEREIQKLNQLLILSTKGVRDGINVLQHRIDNGYTDGIEKYTAQVDYLLERLYDFNKTVPEEWKNFSIRKYIDEFNDLVSLAQDYELSQKSKHEILDKSSFLELEKQLNKCEDSHYRFLAIQSKYEEESKNIIKDQEAEVSAHKKNTEAINQEVAAEEKLQNSKQKSSKQNFSLKKTTIAGYKYKTPDDKYYISQTDTGWKAELQRSSDSSTTIRANQLNELKKKLKEVYDAEVQVTQSIQEEQQQTDKSKSSTKSKIETVKEAVKSIEKQAAAEKVAAEQAQKNVDSQLGRNIFLEAQRRVAISDAEKADDKKAKTKAFINGSAYSAKKSASVFIADQKAREAEAKRQAVLLENEAQQKVNTSKEHELEVSKDNLKTQQEITKQIQEQASAQNKVADAAEREQKTKETSKQKSKSNKASGNGVGSGGKGPGGPNIPGSPIDSSDEWSQDEKELFRRINNARRGIWGYYSGGHDITTGKFNLKNYKNYVHQNREINETLNILGDSNNQDIIKGRKEINDAYQDLIRAKENCVKDMQIIINLGRAVGDISALLSDDDLLLTIDKLDAIADKAFKNASSYHAKGSQAEKEKLVADQMRYLSKNADAHFTDNAFKKAGLLSPDSVNTLKLANKEWGEHYAIVHSYFQNVEHVSDDLRKQFKNVDATISKARDTIAPSKLKNKQQSIVDTRDKDVLDAIGWLSSNADKYLTYTGLDEKGLLKEVPRKNLISLESQWYKYANAIGDYFKTQESVQAEVQKQFDALIADIERIEKDVVDKKVQLERESRSRSDQLSGQSAKDKAVKAYNYFNNYQNEYKYRRLSALAEEGLLSSKEKAQLYDINEERSKQESLIKVYEDQNGVLADQLAIRRRIEQSAKDLAQAELDKIKGRAVSTDNPYSAKLQDILDIQYRMINFQEKRDTVGLTDLELNELERAVQAYNRLYQSLSKVDDKSGQLDTTLKTIAHNYSTVSDKLSKKWSDIRDRRYGSYLNDSDQSSYHSRHDIEAGLQRYVSRQGAKSFELFDGKSVGNIQKYRAEILDFDGTVEKLNLTLNKTTGELYSVSAGTKQATTFFESFGAGLKRRAINLAQYAMTFAQVRYAIGALKSAVNNVKELDSAFVELSRISNDSTTSLEEFRKKSFEVADSVGSTAAQVINAAAQWEHLGYNIKEASELAEVSMIYKNIADGMSSDAEATEDLVSIMKAYDFQADQAIDVTDALIAVSNNYAVTAADIGNALKRSASAMAVANNTFEQNVALATAMAEVTQNAEKSGSALQVLSLRIRGAKTELQEMGEDTDGMASSTSKLRNQIKGLTKGFDIMKDETTFKQTYDIMKGIAAVWDDLDDIQRAQLLETLAGKVRANQVAALLDNFSQAEKVLKTIAEDEGTAIANNEAKLNTIEARITKFRNATQHLTADIFQPELIKDVIDGGTSIVNILDTIIQKFGVLAPLAGVFGFASTAKSNGIIGSISSAIDNYKKRGAIGDVQLSPDKYEAYRFMLDNKQLGTEEAAKALSSFTDEEVKLASYMAKHNMDFTQQAQAIEQLGLQAKKSGGLFGFLKTKAVGAIEGLGTAFANMAIAVTAAMVISKIVEVIADAVTYSDRLAESAQKAAKQISDSNKAIDDFGERIEKQRSIIKDHSSQIEQVSAAQSELRKIKEEMLDVFGDEADGYDLVTAAIEGQTNAIRNLKKAQTDRYIEEYKNSHNGVGDWFGQLIAGIADSAGGDRGQYDHSDPVSHVRDVMEEYTDNVANALSGALVQVVSNRGDTTYKRVLNESIQKVANDYIQDEKNGLKLSGDNVTGPAASVKGLYEAIQKQVEQEYNLGNISKDVYDVYISDLNSKISKVDSQINNLNTIYGYILESNDIYNNPDLTSKLDRIDEIVNKYDSTSGEEREKLMREYLGIMDGIQNDSELSAGVKDYVSGLYRTIDKEIRNWNFADSLINGTDQDLKRRLGKIIKEMSVAAGHTITSEELLGWNKDSHQHDGLNQYYNQIRDTVTSSGATMGGAIPAMVDSGVLMQDEVAALDESISELGVNASAVLKKVDLSTLSTTKNLQFKFQSALKRVGDNFDTNFDKAVAALKLVESESKQTSEQMKKNLGGDMLADFTAGLQKLNEVFDSNGNVKWSTVQSKAFEEAFGNITDDTGRLTSAFNDFKKVLATTSDTDEIQKAFDDLATSYVYNSEVMDNLTEENAKFVEGALSEGGVANAAEVVAYALKEQRAEADLGRITMQASANGMYALRDANQELGPAMLTSIDAFLDEKIAAGEDTSELARLIVQKLLVNGTTLSTAVDVGQLESLAKQCGITADALYEVLAAKSAVGSLAAYGASYAPDADSEGVGDSAFTSEAYQRKMIERKQKADREQMLRDIQKAREEARVNTRIRDTGSSGSGGGGGSGNKEPSKTDKEFDYVNRYLQILQEQNDELRENVDNQYVIFQDAKENAVTFQDALSDLGSAQRELDALGVGYKSDEFQEFIDNLDLSAPADEIMDNVHEITGAYDEINTILNDTPGMVQPTSDAQPVPPDDIWKLIPNDDELWDAIADSHAVAGMRDAVDDELSGYDDVTKAVVKYKTALEDLANAKDATSKTLSENGTGQLTYIKQLQESDQKLIDAYKEAASSYGTEWADYQKKILESWGEEKGQQYIKDILYGNLNPEEWERMITYDQNNQADKDKVELLERGQTAYDHQKESLKTMREWQQKLNEDIQKEYEIRLNIVKAEMVAIENKMNEAQFDLDMKEVLGEVVQEADYQRLIDISGEQVENYRQQLDVLNEQLDTLDEGEQAWYDCKQQIADCENSIRECVKQQAEWNEAILRMPVENISRFLGLVKNLGQTLKNWLSVNDAKGIAQTAEQIQTSWQTAFEQISDDDLGLMKQLEDYKDLLQNYDLGSSKFSEVDDEIQGVRDSVGQLIEEMVELNRQLLNLPIDKISEMTTYLDGTLSDLQSIQSDYETTINTVIDLINHQTEQIQDEYEELQKKIEDQISPLEKQIEELEKANDARDRQLAIENALYELEKAREQKTVQVKLIA